MRIEELKLISESSFQHKCGYKWGNLPEGKMEEMPYSAFRWLTDKERIKFVAYNAISGKISREMFGCYSMKTTIYYFPNSCLMVPFGGEKMYYFTPLELYGDVNGDQNNI